MRYTKPISAIHMASRALYKRLRYVQCLLHVFYTVFWLIWTKWGFEKLQKTKIFDEILRKDMQKKFSFWNFSEICFHSLIASTLRTVLHRWWGLSMIYLSMWQRFLMNMHLMKCSKWNFAFQETLRRKREARKMQFLKEIV